MQAQSSSCNKRLVRVEQIKRRSNSVAEMENGGQAPTFNGVAENIERLVETFGQAAEDIGRQMRILYIRMLVCDLLCFAMVNAIGVYTLSLKLRWFV